MQESKQPVYYENLLEILEQASQGGKGITFITGEGEDAYLSYKALYQKSLEVLYHLQERGLRPGDELIFQIEGNGDFISVFWACIMGKIRPVPLALGTNEEHKQKILKIWQILNRPYMITSAKIAALLGQGLDDVSLTKTTDEIKSRTILMEDANVPKGIGSIHRAKRNEIAFIQFSSGSTGDPKGVVLTHENLIVNMTAIIEDAKATEADSSLSWVPLTHDLGLIGFHLTPMMRNMHQYIMPAFLFLTKPIIWLLKAQQYKVTLLSSPNFGYKHFLGAFKPEMAQGWDLSHIRLIFNGAEPISAELSDAFYHVMANWGLKPTAAFPVFGMAEASLAVSFVPAGEGLTPIGVDRRFISVGKAVRELDGASTDRINFVDLGYPVGPMEIRICDDEGTALAEGTAGHIQIRGKNVTQGYYNNPEATKAAFTADGWLKTGDLGFMKKGRLIVTGRAKDIIFVNGQNIYPHDIERIAGALSGMDAGKLAVCGGYSPTSQKEDILLFVQYIEGLQEFAPKAVMLKKHINKFTGLDVGHVIPTADIPRTASGKIQRYKLKEEFEKGSFDAAIKELDEWIRKEMEAREICLPANETEEELVKIWSEVLGIGKISTTDSFFELGGDSLKATYIASKIYKAFDVEIPLRDLFGEPTVKALAEYIQKADKKVYTPIEKAAEQEYYEVSSAQKRIYILNELNGSDTSYNISEAMGIQGELDKDAFEKACQKLIERHESLRTVFALQNGEPVQKIQEEVDFHIDYIEAAEEDVPHVIKKFIKPFDLGKAPLIRIALIGLQDKKHILLADTHHIISDGTSMGILLRELIHIYNGKTLHDLKTCYKDFALWQKAQYDRIRSQESFWLNQFEGEIPVLELMTDYPRPGYQSFEGDKLSFEIGEELTNRLKAAAKEKGASLYMMLLTAYYVLLAKYSTQEDMVIGTPAAGRLHPDLENVVGMFVNTLALRNYPNGEKTFEAFLSEVRDNALQAFENQEFPFEILVEKLHIKRDMSRNPLFDTMFVLQNMKMAENPGESIQFEPFPFKNNIAKFDLTLFAQESKGGIRFELEYCTALFKEGTIKAYGVHYINILKEIAQDTSKKLSELQMLSQDEKDRVIYQYNETQSDYEKNKTIYQLFEEQVQKTPEDTAVLFRDKKLSYRELNEKSNQLARKLREKGVKPDSVVGIIAERSMEFIISVLAVLKSGGAYLPIATEYPDDRIRYMLKDSGVDILLTQNHLMGRPIFEGTTINIEDEALYTGDDSNLNMVNSVKDLVYIIYTSGSTGKPKGVMIEHQGLVNYITWAAKQYPKGPKPSFPLYTTISFDLTVTSIYTPLITGGAIVIYEEDDKELLVEKVIRENKVDIIKLTPAHLKIIQGRDNTSSNVKALVVGGEQLETELAKAIYQSFGGDIAIYNEYGPTETVVGCMIYKYDPEKDQKAAVPIGIPADNVQIYILDKYKNPVPQNVPGEIYISGDGVARGYINRPELTSERFVDNPFVIGTRMYKTGDLASWMLGGNILFIGRIDEQVKIRGYRIEIGEIENQLLKHEAIDQAVVIVKEDSAGGKYLAAYMTAHSPLTVTALREHIGKALPEYMIPAQFTQLDAMPLTQNGKVDRKALKQMAETLTSGAEYAAAANEIEEAFASVWSQVLGVEKVGVQDNYFALGGDSIKAIQIVSRLNQIGIEVHVKDILTYQTIARICMNVDFNAKQESYDQGIIEGAFGLTPIHRWFIEQNMKQDGYYNQSVLLTLKKDISLSHIEKAFKKLIEHHDGLRLNLDRENKQMYFNNAHLQTELPMAYFDLSHLPDSDLKEAIEKLGQNIKSGFDLTRDLLIKAARIDIHREEKLLLITAHHMIVDGISWRILLEDLHNILTALENNTEFQLPSKTASMKIWYEKLSEYIESGAADAEAPYWEEADRTEFVIPQDYDTKDWNAQNHASVKGVLDKGETDKLLRDCHKAYNTEINDILITALAQTIREWTEACTMTIEMESHGRHLNTVNVSRTIGWFTSIYPMKLHFTKESSGDQIKEIKEQLRKAPQGGIGYGLLKYMKRNEGNQKPSEIRFNYLGQFEQEADNDLFRQAHYSTGSEIDESNQMSAKIEINCMTVGGVFEVDFTYNRKAFKDETVTALKNSFLNRLRALISHTMTEEDVHFTPSDFETVDIGQEDLDSLFG